MTATVVWLTEMGLDITIQKVQAYRVFGDRIVVTVSQHFPVQDVEEFTVSPQRAQAQVTEERRRTTREKSTVHQLVAGKTIPEGRCSPCSPTTRSPRRSARRSRIGSPRTPTRPGELVQPAQGPVAVGAGRADLPALAAGGPDAHEAAEVTRTPRGPSWWVLPDGRDLTTAAGAWPSPGSTGPCCTG